VNQSWSFSIAMAAACVEYILESAFVPSIKQSMPLIVLGTLGIAFGELFRKGAMICAAHNFTHQVNPQLLASIHVL
jgi:hypothetical protein